jgi:predicted  nucleic acid-binding Zn-ribbon protein
MTILIALILTILPLTACEQVSSLVPKALASDTQEVISQVEADSNDVFTEIQNNIDLVSVLRTKVETAKIEGTPLSLDDVIKDIRKVSTSYDKFSGQHEAIRKGLLKKIATIEDMQEEVDAEIDTLKQRRADYVVQLRQVNDPNPDIIKTRQESLTQAIRYLDAQIQLWTEFNAIEADIVAEINGVQQQIDSFLSIIDSSALLFREGLNLLQLQKNINDALSLFTQDLPRIEQLSEDMKESWSNLDYLINSLTSISNYNIK